jgi:glutaminase
MYSAGQIWENGKKLQSCNKPMSTLTGILRLSFDSRINRQSLQGNQSGTGFKKVNNLVTEGGRRTETLVNNSIEQST